MIVLGKRSDTRTSLLALGKRSDTRTGLLVLGYWPDTTPPNVSSVDEWTGTPHILQATLLFEEADPPPYSNVQDAYYKHDSDPTEHYVVDPPSDLAWLVFMKDVVGAHTLEWWCTDVAGNASAHAVRHYEVDADGFAWWTD